MEAAYQDIAIALHESCPPGYSRAWIEAEVGDDWDDQTLWCEAGGVKSQPRMAAEKQLAVGRNLRSLRVQMTAPGEAPWTYCTFTLFPDGKFKFDVKYDD